MKRLLLICWFLGLVVALSMAACAKGLSIDLYNHTDMDLLVDAGKGPVPVLSGQTVRADWASYVLKVSHGSTVWTYLRSEMQPLLLTADRLNLDRRYVNKDDVVKVQVNPGGRALVLRTDESFPADEALVQSRGYALLPGGF